MSNTDTRAHKRLRLSAHSIAASTDPWDFLSPWPQQLNERLLGNTVVAIERHWDPVTEAKRPERFDTSHWRTREALELLVLVHAVNNQAWARILREKCGLRFANEEDLFDANNDDEEEDNTPRRRSGATSKKEPFKFECEREREVPLSPRFLFRADLGNQNPGGVSPVAKWRNFFLPHTSDYEPSPEFSEAKTRILMMQDEEFKKHPRVPPSVEIPVYLYAVTTTVQEVNHECVAYMRELRELVEEMKCHSRQRVGDVESVGDCASTFTYRLKMISLSICNVDVSEAFVESLLGVLGTGIAIGTLQLMVYNAPRQAGSFVRQFIVDREALAKLFTGVLVGPSDPSLEIHSIRYFEFAPGCNWIYEALCCTLAVARTRVESLSIQGNSRLQHPVELLAGALFSSNTPRRTSHARIRGLDVSFPNFSADDLQKFASAVKVQNDDPACLEQAPGTEWQLREGTLLRFDDGSNIVTKHEISIPVTTNRKLLLESTGSRWDLVEMGVPGYGKCQVRRGVLVSQEEPSLNARPDPVNELSIYFSAGADVLENLLSQIGWSLCALRLQYFGGMDDEKMMTAILNLCPKLTSLAIHTCDIDLNRLLTTYEQFGEESKPVITSLSLIKIGDFGADHGVSLAKLLGNSRSRLAKHLEELSISTAEESTAVNGSTMRALWVALKKNPKLKTLELVVHPNTLKPWKNRFRQFHGQILPPVPLKQPCKLAFLSAAHPGVDDKGRTVQQLDQRAMSLIFEFAATRVIRSVTMFYRLYE